MSATSSTVGIRVPSRVILLPFFRDSVCTVTLSVPKPMTASRLRRKPSGVSSGSPAIRSMFTWGKAGQMDRLLGRLGEAFDLGGIVESTVEAGRPDTITREKMAVLRRNGVTRVSVNA